MALQLVVENCGGLNNTVSVTVLIYIPYGIVLVIIAQLQPVGFYGLFKCLVRWRDFGTFDIVHVD